LKQNGDPAKANVQTARKRAVFLSKRTDISQGLEAALSGAATTSLAAALAAAGAATTATGSTAFWLEALIGSKGTISKATMLMILISGLIAGPAVSL
jgi:hypothetical protein